VEVTERFVLRFHECHLPGQSLENVDDQSANFAGSLRQGKKLGTTSAWINGRGKVEPLQ